MNQTVKTDVAVTCGSPAGVAAAHADVSEATRFIEQNPDIQFAELLLPDTNGVFRGKWIPAASLPRIYENGIALAKSTYSLDVWGRDVLGSGVDAGAGDPDGLCWPVPGSLRNVPWARTPGAQVLLTMTEPDRTPVFAEPRERLRSIAERFSGLGLNTVAAVELEFYLIDPASAGADRPRPVLTDGDQRVTAKRTYSVDDIRAFETVFADIRTACEMQDIPMDTIIAEGSPGQFEVNLVHQADVLAAADQAALLKRIIKGSARTHGLIASFMAKPFEGIAGNGMHVHFSFTGNTGENRDKNVFGQDPSDTLKGQAIAGLLETMPDVLALLAPSINSFRRLGPGVYTPVAPIWGYENRAAAIRVPDAPPPASRVEHRVAGADANPYLVIAAILAGAHRGITGQLKPPPAVVGDDDDGTATILPGDQRTALDLFSRSSFISEYFGADYVRLYDTVKRTEMATINKVITELEYQTYLRDA